MPVWAVVPARMASRRLPGKVLAELQGLPMVVRVARCAQASACFDRVVVATDDEAIALACAHHHVDVIRTGPAGSGTHRVAAACRGFTGAVVNVQADQPLLSTAHLRSLVAALGPGEVQTLHTVLGAGGDDDVAKVKVAVDAQGRAADFWREPGRGHAHLHVGLYGFGPGLLDACAAAPVTARCAAADLEQLAWLDAGVVLRSHRVDEPRGPSVDTPQDLARVRAQLAAEGIAAG